MDFLPTIMLQAFSPELFTENWTAVAISAVVATMAIGGMFSASRFLSARRHSDAKLTTYECGIPPTPYSWSNINVRFYIFAILFLIFDVEAVFLFPWAASFGLLSSEFGVFVLLEMVVFIGILVVGWLYAWRKKSLEWG